MTEHERAWPISLKNVKVTDPFWNLYVRSVPAKMIPYQWRILNDCVEDAEKSGCIRNFRIAAGDEKGRFHGFVFQDTDLAKWLEAVAYSLSLNKDPALERLKLSGGTKLYSTDRPQTVRTDLRLIPYCFWGNRKPGEMMVWHREVR